MAQFFKLINSQSKTIAFVSQVFIKLAKNTRDFSHEMNWLE